MHVYQKERDAHFQRAEQVNESEAELQKAKALESEMIKLYVRIIRSNDSELKFCAENFLKQHPLRSQILKDEINFDKAKQEWSAQLKNGNKSQKKAALAKLDEISEKCPTESVRNASALFVVDFYLSEEAPEGVKKLIDLVLKDVNEAFNKIADIFSHSDQIKLRGEMDEAMATKENEVVGSYKFYVVRNITLGKEFNGTAMNAFVYLLRVPKNRWEQELGYQFFLKPEKYYPNISQNEREIISWYLALLNTIREGVEKDPHFIDQFSNLESFLKVNDNLCRLSIKALKDIWGNGWIPWKSQHFAKVLVPEVLVAAQTTDVTPAETTEGSVVTPQTTEVTVASVYPTLVKVSEALPMPSAPAADNETVLHDERVEAADVVEHFDPLPTMAAVNFVGNGGVRDQDKVLLESFAALPALTVFGKSPASASSNGVENTEQQRKMLELV